MRFITASVAFASSIAVTTASFDYVIVGGESFLLTRASLSIAELMIQVEQPDLPSLHV